MKKIELRERFKDIEGWFAHYGHAGAGVPRDPSIRIRHKRPVALKLKVLQPQLRFQPVPVRTR